MVQTMKFLIYGTFSIRRSHPSWAQIFASGSSFLIPLALIPPIMLHFHIAQMAILLLQICFLVVRVNRKCSVILKAQGRGCVRGKVSQGSFKVL